ncbi:unnamed protein product [Brassica oleracea var. botrytis]
MTDELLMRQLLKSEGIEAEGKPRVNERQMLVFHLLHLSLCIRFL